MLAMPLVRTCLLAAAAFVVPGGNTPVVGGNASGTSDRIGTRAGSSLLSSSILFRGQPLRAPPGVRVLSSNTVLLGGVAVELPSDVTLEFSESGEAVFALAKDAPPRAWVLTVGKKKLVASASARAIVPLPGVGEPRIEWSRSAYPVPAPRDSLNRARDLKDPFDASPYR